MACVRYLILRDGPSITKACGPRNQPPLALVALALKPQPYSVVVCLYDLDIFLYVPVVDFFFHLVVVRHPLRNHCSFSNLIENSKNLNYYIFKEIKNSYKFKNEPLNPQKKCGQPLQTPKCHEKLKTGVSLHDPISATFAYPARDDCLPYHCDLLSAHRRH